jgi:hypothetical protein
MTEQIAVSTETVAPKPRAKPGPKPKVVTTAPPTPAAVNGKVVKAAGPKMTIVLKHGTYIGAGCKDPTKRLQEEHEGFGYDHDHPAQPGERLELDGVVARKMLGQKGSCFETVEMFESRRDSEQD